MIARPLVALALLAGGVVSGKSLVPAGQDSVVVPFALPSGAKVTARLPGPADATCTSVKSVIPGARSFTITLNAACTAPTVVIWTLR